MSDSQPTTTNSPEPGTSQGPPTPRGGYTITHADRVMHVRMMTGFAAVIGIGEVIFTLLPPDSASAAMGNVDLYHSLQWRISAGYFLLMAVGLWFRWRWAWAALCFMPLVMVTVLVWGKWDVLLSNHQEWSVPIVLLGIASLASGFCAFHPRGWRGNLYLFR